jgi:hypothetical protein
MMPVGSGTTPGGNSFLQANDAPDLPAQTQAWALVLDAQNNRQAQQDTKIQQFTASGGEPVATWRKFAGAQVSNSTSAEAVYLLTPDTSGGDTWYPAGRTDRGLEVDANGVMTCTRAGAYRFDVFTYATGSQAAWRLRRTSLTGTQVALFQSLVNGTSVVMVQLAVGDALVLTQQGPGTATGRQAWVFAQRLGPVYT